MGESLYPRMVQEYYVSQVRKVAAVRAEQRAKIRTRAAVMRLRQEVRRKLSRCFGLPTARAPLKPVTTGVLRRRSYTVEKVSYESHPGFKVTANLYVPRGGGPFPVVLGPCGHSGNGKAYDFYQAFATGLVRRGYMVLVYDPQGQGERRQITRRIGSFVPGNACHEHNLFGKRLALLGDFFGSWFVWDGIRSLDYLLSRPEADATRVGVTGNSGGGTLSTYLSALDDRFTMVAPSCFVTTFQHNVENELPQDAEQMPPGILAEGLGMADYFVAQIPRPVLLLGQVNDFFDPRGLRETYEELRRLYRIVGASENVQLFIGPRSHGFHPENREAMYRFFARHADRPEAVRPSESKPEEEKDLLAAPGGSVRKAGSRLMPALLKEEGEAVEASRRPLDDDDLKRAITEVLALPKRRGAPHFRNLRPRPSGSKRLPCQSLFAVETEPGIQAILHLYAQEVYEHLPKRPRAAVFVPHVGTEEDVQKGLLPKGREVLAVDVRGMGLSQPRTCGDTKLFPSPYGSDYMYAVHGQMLGEPYMGRRVHDLLRVLDLLAANGCEDVHLIGRGMGALTATFAGCLHAAARRVTLINAPLSYGEMMKHPVAAWPYSAMAQGLLKHFDLPDCYGLLRRTKKLHMVNPWNHLMRAGRQR